MKKWLFFLSLLALLSCSKEEQRAPCEIEQFGTLEVTNISCCPIQVHVNGQFKATLTKDQKELIARVPIGNARIQAYQIENGLKWDANRQMVACEITSVIFRE